jgi:4'-phosphopantetheinyl transferase
MERRDIEVWLIDLARCTALLDAVGTEFGLVRPEDAARVADAHERARRRAVRIALRLALWRVGSKSAAMDTIVTTTTGKPIMAGGLPHISVSHTDTHALVATSLTGTVGVDIEAIRPVSMSEQRRRAIEIAGKLLAPADELSEDADTRFAQAWTRIEALGKATGAGAAATMAALGVRQPGADSATIEACVAAALAGHPAGISMGVRELSLSPLGCANLVASLAHSGEHHEIGLATVPHDRDALLRTFIR